MERLSHPDSASSHTVLLVVNDESAVCRALRRMLGSRVTEVLTAQSPAEAEIILASRRVTHLIADQWFGRGQPLGIDLVPRWRAQHVSIERAIILTGSDVASLERPTLVDRVLPKTATSEQMAEALRL